MQKIEARLTDLEISFSNQERIVDDLNDEVIRLSKIVEHLVGENKRLKLMIEESLVKPQSEETPPPHY
ncbi:MAG: SlyX family protein [Lactobacillales bacterium]|jgi:uncharacterized coiled-coil protein SlyX|nr:SlyX family protein [Lactobacillales bacterium]